MEEVGETKYLVSFVQLYVSVESFFLLHHVGIRVANLEQCFRTARVEAIVKLPQNCLKYKSHKKTFLFSNKNQAYISEMN